MGSGTANELALLGLEAQSKMVGLGTVLPLVVDGSEIPISGNWQWSYRAERAESLFQIMPQEGPSGLYRIVLTGRTKSGRVREFRTYKLLTINR